ncbi:MAG TPA: DnaJ C-terminal domain-containing protein, partial [Micromonosporaceae bacterium]
GRSGDDLTLTVPITFAEAVLGTDLRVPTLDGAVTLRVPPGTPSGRTLRARGKGVSRRNGSAGDLLVTVEVMVPGRVSAEAREALEKFAANTPSAGREQIDARVRRFD